MLPRGKREGGVGKTDKPRMGELSKVSHDPKVLAEPALREGWIPPPRASASAWGSQADETVSQL